MGGVDPAHRRRGHGSALLRWRIDHAMLAVSV
jgi:ribosomal protein S18 acetylase RimI-like enzyme